MGVGLPLVRLGWRPPGLSVPRPPFSSSAPQNPEDFSLVRCDAKFPDKGRQTYVNESLGHSSVIDYFICDAGDSILDYSVLDPEINLSDHLPVIIRCKCVYPCQG